MVTPYGINLMVRDSTGCGHSDDHDVRWHTLVAHSAGGSFPAHSRRWRDLVGGQHCVCVPL